MTENIFLYGPPGSGKSTLAKNLAEQLGWTWFDIDTEVEKSIGTSISDFVVANGIEQFRVIESATIQTVIQLIEKASRVVVSLGGGALLDERNKTLCESAGKIIFVDTDLEILIDRVKAQVGTRPLLDGNEEQRLRDLMTSRQAHYDTFKLRVANNGSVNWPTFLDKIENSSLHSVGAMGKPYEVIVLPGAADFLPTYLNTLTDRAEVGIVFDSNTARYYRESITQRLEKMGYIPNTNIIPAGEEYKTLSTIEGLWDFYVKSGFDRKSLILAVGGGVVSDLVGFASATYMRGCQWVCVPTSLLSMVDASIGGKTGFDLSIGKNLIGAFYPPRSVIIDPTFLNTLPEGEYVSGLAEVIKHGIIADANLFIDCAKGLEFIKENISSIIARAVKVKVEVIEEDPFEQGKRASLNLGHTIGHAIELESGFKLKHGEAVAIGLVLECVVAEELGIAENGLTERISSVLANVGLPVQLSDGVDKKKVIEFMWNDKKKSGKSIRFALPKKIGEVITGVELDHLEDMI